MILTDWSKRLWKIWEGKWESDEAENSAHYHGYFWVRPAVGGALLCDARKQSSAPREIEPCDPACCVMEAARGSRKRLPFRLRRVGPP